MKNGTIRRIFPPAVFLMLAVLFIAVLPCGAEAEDEWTVMFYMCGTDLESKQAYATDNLEDIAACSYPVNLRESIFSIYGEELPEEENPLKVNVVIETGGCKKWHAGELNMDISTEKLQRWEYNSLNDVERAMNPDQPYFILKDEQPLASMAAPGTLKDFILWAVENYPARKYALVLWDHGGGSKSGLFIDELYQGDIMRLTELQQALEESGVILETILFDACMMANIETAYCVKDSAKWMVASEELVAGQGTAISSWLDQLYRDPQADGKELGIWICDMTQIKYSGSYNESSGSILTWSLIDLSKIERVSLALNAFFQRACMAYEKYPLMLSVCMSSIRRTEEYGTGVENMFDLMGILYDEGVKAVIDTDVRWELLKALSDTVEYSVRGSGRSAARGLSFCFASDFTDSELDIYSANCPSPYYLALLDAVNVTWDAPDWVYEENRAPKLPEITEMEEYTIRARKGWTQDGLPGLTITAGQANYNTMFYRMYRFNEELNETVSIGKFRVVNNVTAEGSQIFSASEPSSWPSVDGVICCLNVIQSVGDRLLCEIPIRLDMQNWKLRCGYIDGEFEIYGIWDGYDADSTEFNRNVVSLAKMAGCEYQMLYPVDTDSLPDHPYYEVSKPLTMNRVLDVAEIPLEPGTYYMEYVVEDIFMRQMAVDRIEMVWDGESFSFPGREEWAGEITLQWLGWPEDRTEP